MVRTSFFINYIFLCTTPFLTTPSFHWCIRSGVNVALLNTHITKKSLVHCISIAGTNILIFGDECSKQVDEIKCELINYRYFIHSATENDQSTIPSFAENLNIALESAPSITLNAHAFDIVFCVCCTMKNESKNRMQSCTTSWRFIK